MQRLPVSAGPIHLWHKSRSRWKLCMRSRGSFHLNMYYIRRRVPGGSGWVDVCGDAGRSKAQSPQHFRRPQSNPCLMYLANCLELYASTMYFFVPEIQFLIVSFNAQNFTSDRQETNCMPLYHMSICSTKSIVWVHPVLLNIHHLETSPSKSKHLQTSNSMGMNSWHAAHDALILATVVKVAVVVLVVVVDVVSSIPITIGGVGMIAQGWLLY